MKTEAEHVAAFRGITVEQAQNMLMQIRLAAIQEEKNAKRRRRFARRQRKERRER
jgi:hypothetical protein